MGLNKALISLQFYLVFQSPRCGKTDFTFLVLSGKWKVGPKHSLRLGSILNGPQDHYNIPPLKRGESKILWESSWDWEIDIIHFHHESSDPTPELLRKRNAVPVTPWAQPLGRVLRGAEMARDKELSSDMPSLARTRQFLLNKGKS